MSLADRALWDARWSDEARKPSVQDLPVVFADQRDLFPTKGTALDLGCGNGESAVWLALRGMSVLGVDVSPIAIDLARRLAAESRVSERCRFEVFDLDGGLPPGHPVDLIFCHLFRDPRLYGAMMERLALGGLLAVAVLSEVDHGPGEFRARAGELRATFVSLEVLAEGEGDGKAWILGRRSAETP